MTNITVPDGWSEISTGFEQQEHAFQRGRDGLVLSIEKGVALDKYAVSFLPENFYEDNQVVKSYGDNGYLYSGDSFDEAVEKAEVWMRENKQ